MSAAGHSLLHQLVCPALDGHVVEAQQGVEGHAVVLPQLLRTWEERAAEVGAPTQQYSRSALQAKWEAHVMFQGPLGKGQLSGVVCRPIKPVRAAAAAAVPAGWWQPSCGLRQHLPHSRARQLPQHSCACSDHPATRLLVSRPSMLCASKGPLDSAPGQPWQAAKSRLTCL